MEKQIIEFRKWKKSVWKLLLQFCWPNGFKWAANQTDWTRKIWTGHWSKIHLKIKCWSLFNKLKKYVISIGIKQSFLLPGFSFNPWFRFSPKPRSACYDASLALNNNNNNNFYIKSYLISRGQFRSDCHLLKKIKRWCIGQFGPF